MNGNEGIIALVGGVAVVFFAVFSMVYALDEQSESPIRRWRKLRTPPCRLCAYSSNYGHCVCPAAVEREERLNGGDERRLPSGKVRGTRFCVFEPKKEEE